MDCWISLRNVEASGERNRILYLLKSRGMNHSKQLREYRLTDDGIEMLDAYLGHDGVLTGSARAAQEAQDREQELARRQSIERRRRELARRRAATERQVAELMAALESEESEVSTLIEQEEARETALETDRMTMAQRRNIRQ